MSFHHRNMLIRSGMVDGLDGMFPDDFFHSADITDVTDHWNDFQIRMLLLQFLFDFEKLAFRLVKSNQSSRSEGRCLPTEFRPDGAGGTRDQDALTGNALLNTVFFETNLLPSEKIFKREISQLSAQILS